MLKSALPFKQAFINLSERDANYLNCPTDEEWNEISMMKDFLEVFNIGTSFFLGFAKFKLNNNMMHFLSSYPEIRNNSFTIRAHAIHEHESNQQTAQTKYQIRSTIHFQFNQTDARKVR
jgi:hypothetical protein